MGGFRVVWLPALGGFWHRVLLVWLLVSGAFWCRWFPVLCLLVLGWLLVSGGFWHWVASGFGGGFWCRWLQPRLGPHSVPAATLERVLSAFVSLGCTCRVPFLQRRYGFYGHLYILLKVLHHLGRTGEQHLNVTRLVRETTWPLPLVPQPPPDCRSVAKFLTFTPHVPQRNNRPSRSAWLEQPAAHGSAVQRGSSLHSPAHRERPFCILASLAGPDLQCHQMVLFPCCSELLCLLADYCFP